MLLQPLLPASTVPSSSESSLMPLLLIFLAWCLCTCVGGTPPRSANYNVKVALEVGRPRSSRCQVPSAWRISHTIRFPPKPGILRRGRTGERRCTYRRTLACESDIPTATALPLPQERSECHPQFVLASASGARASLGPQREATPHRGLGIPGEKATPRQGLSEKGDKVVDNSLIIS